MPTQDENMKAMAEKLGQGYNATTGQMVDPNKGVLEQLPTGSQSQRDANVDIRNIATAEKLGQKYNIDTQQFESGPTALEVQRNKEQAAFNARNPAGTRVEDIKGTAIENIAPASSFKGATAPIDGGQAMVTPTTPTTTVKTQKNTSLQTNVPEVDFNSSVGREDQIGNNLTTITQQTPALLTDRAGYDKAFGYATADEGKKALLDGFFKSGKQAMDNAKAIRQWSNASVNDIGASLLDGSISSSTYNSLLSDPLMSTKIKKAEELNRIASKKKDITTAGVNQTTEVLASLPTIASAMENNELSGEEIAALTSTPEQVALKKKKDAQWEDLNKKTAIWDSIENDIDKQTAGGRYSATDKAQMVANARKLLLPELNRAERNYNNTITQLTDLKKEALGVLETNLGLYKEKKEATAKIEADKTNFQQQKDIMDYQNKLSQANITTEKIVDPATGKTVLINSKTGDIVASYNTGLKSEAMTPYEQAQIDIKREEAKAGKNINIQKIGENDYGYINSNGELVKIGKEATSEIPTGTRDVTGYLNAAKAGVNDVYGSCGKFANDYSGVGSEPGGDDTIAGRTKTYTDTEPVVGGMAFFTGGGYNKTNGHVAVVTGRSADGKTISVRESNFRGDNKVTERTIPTTFVKGYYNSTPLATKTSGNEGMYDPAMSAMYSKFAASAKGLSKNDLSIINSSGGLEKFKQEAKSYVVDLAKNEIPTLQTYKEDLQYLIDNKELRSGINTGIFSPLQMIDYKAKFDAIKARTALKNLVDLKKNGATFGSLSNQELSFITNASEFGNVTKWGSDKAYEEEIKKIIAKVDKGISNIENGNIFGNTTGNVTPTKTSTQASTQTSDSDPLGILK